MEIKTKRMINILIDDEDISIANNGKSLFITKNGFVIISKRVNKNLVKHIYLHKIIMNCPKDFQVDHINGNRLDNRKNNLRICTHAENQRNKKKRTNGSHSYKGVLIRKRLRKDGTPENSYYAKITLNGKSYCKHGFKTEKEAAEAYNILAKKYHGEFANLNVSS